MRRGTTPSIRLTTDADLGDCKVSVAIKNGRTLIVKTGDELEIETAEDSSSVTFTLTQEETLQLDPVAPARMQIRFKRGESACATEIKQVKVRDILQEEVI